MKALPKIIMLASLTSSTCFAGDMGPISTASDFSGPYVGVAGGGVFSIANVTSSTSANMTNQFSSSTTLSNSVYGKTYKQSAVGMVSIGTGFTFNAQSAYVGAEIFSSVANRNMALNGDSQYVDPVNLEINTSLNNQVSVKLQSVDFGGDLKWGYLFQPSTLGYLRTGVGFDRLKLSSNNRLVYIDNSFTPSVTANSGLANSNSKTLAGLRLGLGMEHAVSQSFHMSFDVVYTIYNQSFSSSGTGPTLSTQSDDPATPVVFSTGFNNNTSLSNINTVNAMIGIKYYI